MEKNQQEIMFKLSMFEQQMQQIQQQLQAVEQGIVEMSNLNLGLEVLVGSKDKEILAPIGRGIFVKTKLLSEELTVDIGGKNFVKKSIPEAKEIIDKQIKKLDGVKNELNNNLEKSNAEFMAMVQEAQASEGKHDENCGCGKCEE
jgi:prefoldin alpha subunit